MSRQLGELSVGVYWRRLVEPLLCVLAVLLASPALALTIEYRAIDLADFVQDEDLWRYEYAASDGVFLAGGGFFIDFDYNIYGALQDPPTLVNVDWDVVSISPVLQLSPNGSYDALALVDNPSLADAFTLTFIWRGQGAPGAQPFYVYDGDFQTVETGMTVPFAAASLPGTLLLLGAGLFGLWGHSARSDLTKLACSGRKVGWW